MESDASLAEQIRGYLDRSGWNVVCCDSAIGALDALARERPDAAIVECASRSMLGPAILSQMVLQDAYVKVIALASGGGVSEAVAAMKSGAYEYLPRPIVLRELAAALDRALREDRDRVRRNDVAMRRANPHRLENIIGESPPIAMLKSKVRRLLDAEMDMREGDHPAVLITGETGTGKELVARALHFDGKRREGPFVEVNCASLPVNLLESELFGHERGAFTDAKERKVGLVEAAEGGTLFLDEIGEVDLSIQAKLLKLLEERTVRRVGSTRERRVDVRIVSATNQDLEKMVREGRFRSDLYFRLRIISLHMPPLRERREDVLPLARHFLALHGNRYGKRGLELSPEAQHLLLGHSWPGNVRELKNCAEQAVLLTHDSHVHPETMALRTFHQEGDAATAGGPGDGECIARGAQLSRARVEAVIEETNGNVTRAARMLGISRDTLRYRIRKYGLSSRVRLGPDGQDATACDTTDVPVASAGGHGRQ